MTAVNSTPSSDSSSAQEGAARVDLPARGPVELLFLLCHGVGGQAAQMAPLAAALRAQYPQAAIVSLNGSEPNDGLAAGAGAAGSGFQWFSMGGLDGADGPALLAERVGAALPGFIARVRRWAAHFELDWPRVALAGFSQGAILSLEALQAEPRLAGRVIALAGAYAWLPQQAPQEVCVHLLHGMDDAVLPYRPIVGAARALLDLGADVTADVLPGVGHTVHPQLVDKAMEQLRSFVPARLWREAVVAAAEQQKQERAQ
ncbi:MAG: esterase [Burkholderiaceae bacterium]